MAFGQPVFKVPSALSFLRASDMPKEGGATQWADTRAAWEALPGARQAELQDLVAINDLQKSRVKTGHTLTDEDRKRWRFEQEAAKPISKDAQRMEKHWSEGIIPDTRDNVMPSRANATILLRVDSEHRFQIEEDGQCSPTT